MRKSETISSLIPDSRNANKGNPRGTALLEDSLRKHGAGRSILLDKNNRVIAGNKTLEGAASIGLEDVQIVESDGRRLIAVKRTDIDLETPEGRELALADNRVGEINLEWDADVLAAFQDEGVDLSALWFDNELTDLLDSGGGIGGVGGTSNEQAHATLAERFGVPPFSVLDARQGYWQERKRAWIALGIQSELGRGGGGVDHERGTGNDGEPELLSKPNGGGQRGHREPRSNETVYANASPGGSPRPACDYSGKQRGDGRGRAIIGT